jgi:hypothetical protein
MPCGQLGSGPRNSPWHLFKNDANRIGIAVAVAAVTPLILFALLLWLSASLRQFMLSIA